jgi:hypothetical protein
MATKWQPRVDVPLTPSRDTDAVMNTHAWALARIEEALDERPACEMCGAHTTVVEIRGDLWLACSTLEDRRGGVLGLLARLVPHERRLLIDREYLRAA